MANLKNLTVNNTKNLTLPTRTNLGRPANPQTGVFHLNSDAETIEVYNGNSWKPMAEIPIRASGGIITEKSVNGQNYRIHAFTSNGNFLINSAPDNAKFDILVVGGGGSGGTGDDGGGGGAGGLIFEPGYNLPRQIYSIIVGSGGNAPDTTSRGNSVNGENTDIVGSITGLELRALGGGRGESYDNNPLASSGGSGGGTAANDNQAGSGLQPTSQWGGFGNDGGNNRSFRADDGSGGGGAGQAGGTNGQYSGGDGLKEVTIGGITYNFSEIFGSEYGEDADGDGNSWFAGGGMGGGELASSSNDTPGKGGGADSFSKPSVPNTGGGGAAFDDDNANTAVNDGASGIVIIRYPI